MFKFRVNKNQIRLDGQAEKMTSGSQNVYVCEFSFSEEWDDLEKVAVFALDVGPDGPLPNEVWNQLLPEDNRCMIPWELNVTHYRNVYVGVFGTMDGNVVLPTVWIDIGQVVLGVTTGLEIGPPTPMLYGQILNELRLIRRDVKSIEVGSALEVVDMMDIGNADYFIDLGLPRSVIMIDSNLYTTGPFSFTLPVTSDLLYVSQYTTEDDKDALAFTNVNNDTYVFEYDSNFTFNNAYPLIEELDPSTIVAGGNIFVHDYGSTDPAPGVKHVVDRNAFVGKAIETGDVVSGFGINADGNLFFLTGIVTVNETLPWQMELTSVSSISEKIEGDIPLKPITKEAYDELSEEDKNSDTAWLIEDGESEEDNTFLKPISLEDYESLSDEEKNSETLWFLPDVTDENKHPFVPVSEGRVEQMISLFTKYTEGETRIGTWIDGKPLYRRVITDVTLPNEVNTYNSYPQYGVEALGIDSVVSSTCVVHNSAGGTNNWRTLPYTYISGIPIGSAPTSSSSFFVAVYYISNTALFTNISANHSYINYVGMPLIIILEYTKTSDSTPE